MSDIRLGVMAVLSTALVGGTLLSGAAAIASADDPLAPIIASVRQIRSGTRCAPLVYNPLLEDAAQKYARSENRGDAVPNDYPYRTDAYLGSGDPQDAAIGSAYNRGARTSIIDCSFTEFGVGFIRHDDREVDVVTVIFGEPSTSDATPVAPAQDPSPAAPVQCPTFSSTPTVPAGQACAPSTNSVAVVITKAGLGKVNVALTNSADIDASCAYSAVPLGNAAGILPTIDKTVAVKGKGTVILNENAPPPTITYQVSVPCTGIVNGRNVVMGTSSQTVKG